MTFSGHQDKIRSVAFSPESQHALTSSEDQTACLWDLATGRVLTTFSGHQGVVTSATFSPDGYLVVTWDDRGWVSFGRGGEHRVVS